MNSRRAHETSRGFTLVEVLIALAIVAMSAGALLGALTSAASNISYLHDKTLAEWVALNRLTEIRISQTMPDPGKRSGNAVMGGMRWQWEQEVVELPVVKGLFRVDVRARPTGETVDDSRETQKATAQKDPDTTASGSSLDDVSWSTTVTGVIGASRSDRNTAIATPFRGNLAGGTPNNPGGPGNTPVAPGIPGTPSNPGKPGSPSNPSNPGTPTPRTSM
jgi:type II secretion system protein I